MRGKIMPLYTDSTAVLGMLKKMSGQTAFIPLLKEMHVLMLRLNIRLRPFYIWTGDNVLSDTLSRGPSAKGEFERALDGWKDSTKISLDKDDWQFSPEEVSELDEEFGPFVVDATSDVTGSNEHFTRFWSMNDDCRLHDWAGLNIFCNLPFSIMLSILLHFLRCKLKSPLGTTYAFAAKTRATYASHVRAWVTFCCYFEAPILPATDLSLSQFLVFQSKTCSPASLQGYTAGIRSFHLDNGFPWIHVSARPIVHRTMMGLKRLFGQPSTPKMAISTEHLLAMRKFLDFSKKNDAHFWAACCTAFFGCFRKDNITTEKSGSFNASANLCRGDLLPEGGFARSLSSTWWVRVRHSKTNQTHSRVNLVPLIAQPGSPLCPVASLVVAFACNPNAVPQSPAFCSFDAGGNASPLTHGTFVRRLKELISLIGLDPTKFSGHSFRRGAATLAFSLTGSHELIMSLGDWRSNSYLGYRQVSDQSRCVLPRLMAASATRTVSRAV
jgi:hypothetical protein